MTKREAVLVTAAGSIIGEGLIKCLKFANTISRESSSFSYEIVAADMRSDAAGLYRGHHGEIIPGPREESSYYDALVNVCKKYSIRAIFVGSDEELVPLAKLASKIENETGAKVITNPLSALEIAMDKWKTFKLLKGAWLGCAESSLPENRDEFVTKFGFPVIVKPREGHGSQNLFLAQSSEEMEFALKSIRESGGDPMIQEYLQGEEAEYTTGVVVSGKSDSVICSISMRRKLKHGQTYKAFIEDVELVRKSSEKVALALGGKGPINVQSRLVEGKSKVFEINPRFSASCPIRAVSGVNEPDIVFRDQVLKEDISTPAFRSLVGLRYWNEVYVPLETFERASNTGIVDVEKSFIPDYF
jgi:carbamoyl-phosphate synthase large subunit